MSKHSHKRLKDEIELLPKFPAIVVNVYCLPRSDSSDDGAKLVFISADPALQDSEGVIVVPKDARNIDISFKLKSASIEWTKGDYKGRYDLAFSFAKNPDPNTVLTISEGYEKAKPLDLKTNDVFANPKLSPSVMTITDSNTDAHFYFYSLAVRFKTATVPVVINTDPRIKNGGAN